MKADLPPPNRYFVFAIGAVGAFLAFFAGLFVMASAAELSFWNPWIWCAGIISIPTCLVGLMAMVSTFLRAKVSEFLLGATVPCLLAFYLINQSLTAWLRNDLCWIPHSPWLGVGFVLCGWGFSFLGAAIWLDLQPRED